MMNQQLSLLQKLIIPLKLQNGFTFNITNSRGEDNG